MSDLRPYSYPQNAPLSAGARFIRGFKRIGLALGAIVLLGGLGIAGYIGFDQQRRTERQYLQAACISDRVRNNWPLKMESYDNTRVDVTLSGCAGPLYSEKLPTILSYAEHRPAPLEMVIEPLFWGTLASLAAAAFIFYGFWLVGWLCAGFTRD